jgi:hypothetical protein
MSRIQEEPAIVEILATDETPVVAANSNTAAARCWDHDQSAGLEHGRSSF